MNETRSARVQRVIREVMYHLHIDNVTAFANAIGLTYMKVYYAFNGTNNVISDELADHIVAYCPDIDRNYLITGEGSLLLKDNTADAPVKPVTSDDMLNLIERLTTLFEKVQAAQERLDEREKRLDEREAELMKLMKQYSVCDNTHIA